MNMWLFIIHALKFCSTLICFTGAKCKLCCAKVVDVDMKPAWRMLTNSAGAVSPGVCNMLPLINPL